MAFEVAGAWVGVGSPLAEDTAAAAERFEAAARAVGKKALFFVFGAERTMPGWSALPIGEQPLEGPSDWVRTLANVKSLRAVVERRSSGSAASSDKPTSAPEHHRLA